jgi:hypothetical protein
MIDFDSSKLERRRRKHSFGNLYHRTLHHNRRTERKEQTRRALRVDMQAACIRDVKRCRAKGVNTRANVERGGVPARNGSVQLRLLPKTPPVSTNVL